MTFIPGLFVAQHVIRRHHHGSGISFSVEKQERKQRMNGMTASKKYTVIGAFAAIVNGVLDYLTNNTLTLKGVLISAGFAALGYFGQVKGKDQ